MNEKVYLMILDGFGEGKDYSGNAIAHAAMPNFKKLKKTYPFVTIKAAGNDVGLPDGSQGNSEVGHYTMGAGRIIFQSLEEINRSIKNGEFFRKEPLLQAMEHVKKQKKAALHLIGMISDEGVHAHIEHLFALIKMARKAGVEHVYIHAITDGRDVPERSAETYIKMLEKHLSDGVELATMVGRYYAMDRDNNWDRTQKAYELITSGTGIKETDPVKAIKKQYERGVETDYYIEPIIFNEHGVILEKDAVIFFNFRTDRPRQLTYCFTNEETIGFKRKKSIHPFFVCFGEYSEKAPVVFPPPAIKNNLASVLEQNSKKQLHIAETEKYAHVTYFFNSQVEAPCKNETRVLIDSKKVPSYADAPEMSARAITDAVLKEIPKGYDCIIQNFANPDLVGHSGDFDATVKACGTVDECIGKIAKKTLDAGYDLIITADHGNAEYMVYEENGEQCPSHTTNPVPFLLVSKRFKNARLRQDGGLKDVAPTILSLLGLAKPPEMTGENLIKE